MYLWGHLQGRLAAFRYGGSPTAAIRPFCVGPAVISSCSITGRRPSVPKTSGRGSWIRHGSPSSRTASGTNECIEYCRAIGAEPYFCINLGTGTIGEVADWVEYCNGTSDQPAAEAWIPRTAQREVLGSRQRNLGTWQAGHKSAEDYAKVGLKAAKMMKWWILRSA